MSFLRSKVATLLLVIVIVIGSNFAFFTTPASQAAGWPVFDLSNFFQNTTTAIATTTFDASYFFKEFVVKPLVRLIANRIQNMILNQVFAITRGFNGQSPAFITNWQGEILQSLGQGNDQFKFLLANTQLCPYLDPQIKQLFGADRYQTTSQSNGSNSACVDQCVNQNLAKQCGPPKDTGDYYICRGTVGGNCAGSCQQSSVQTPAANNTPSIPTNPGGIAGLAAGLFQSTTIPGMPSFQTNIHCTLPTNFNLSGLQQNFTGGWQSLNQLLQPQNNYASVLLATAAQQQSQIQLAAQAAAEERAVGGGYKSRRDNGATPLSPSDVQSGQSPVDACFNQCLVTGKWQTINGLPVKVNNTPAQCQSQCSHAGVPFAACKPDQTVFGRCIFPSKILTPGDLFGRTAANAIDDKLKRFGLGSQELTDIIGNLLSAMLESLTNKLFDLGGDSPNLPEDLQQGPNDIQSNPSQVASCVTNCVQQQTQACTAAQGQQPVGPPDVNNPNQNTSSTIPDACSNVQSSCSAQCLGVGISNTPTPPAPKSFGDKCNIQNSNSCGDEATSGLFCAKRYHVCAECSPKHACADGLNCNDGVCVAPGGNAAGARCLADSDCTEGLTCDLSAHSCTATTGSAASSSASFTPTPTISGSGTPGTNGSPVIAQPSQSTVKVGSTLNLNVSNIRPGATGFMLIVNINDPTLQETIDFNASSAGTTIVPITPDANNVGSWQAQAMVNNILSNTINFQVVP